MEYDYRDIYKIKFTEDDVTLALESVTPDQSQKVICRLESTTVRAGVLESFAELAQRLYGDIKSNYGLEILVDKDEDELRAQALHNLRYNAEYADLRDQRAAESGVQPKASEE